METAIALVQLLNTASPGVASLVALIRRKDGGLNVLVVLDEADAQFDANLKQAADWLAKNPQKP